MEKVHHHLARKEAIHVEHNHVVSPDLQDRVCEALKDRGMTTVFVCVAKHIFDFVLGRGGHIVIGGKLLARLAQQLKGKGLHLVKSRAVSCLDS